MKTNWMPNREFLVNLPGRLEAFRPELSRLKRVGYAYNHRHETRGAKVAMPSQISSRSCHFVLWERSPKENTVAGLKSNVLAPLKILASPLVSRYVPWNIGEARQVLLVTPTGNQPRGHVRAKWRCLISDIVWSRLGVDVEPGKILLGLLVPQIATHPRGKAGTKINECCQLHCY